MAPSDSGEFPQFPIQLAIYSRLIILSIQFLANLIIPDHDAGIFTSPGLKDLHFCDRIINRLFGGLKNWDAQYFLHVSYHGYTYENTLAFFPIFPYTVHIISLPFRFITQSFLSTHNCLLLTGLVLNFTCFVVACALLYNLTEKVFENTKLARLSSLVFCLTPASIFFSAYYSESLFCILTFGSLLCIENGRMFFGAALIGLSGATRSNGLITSGFIIYKFLQKFTVELLVDDYQTNNSKPSKLFGKIFLLSVQLFVCIAPFVWFQVYTCLLYCVPYEITLPLTLEVEEYAIMKDLKVPSEELARWCYKTIPFSYSYVQSHYWNVGFLQYYQWKQLPNFMLATPVALLTSINFLNHLGKTICVKTFEEKLKFLLNQKAFVYSIHAFALTVFCFLCIHVQVTTRLLCSSSPIIYWAIASILLNDFENGLCHFKENKDSALKINLAFSSLWQIVIKGSIMSKIALSYCILYAFIGTILFSNSLPWT